MFIQIIGSHQFNLRHACLVKNPFDFMRPISQISGINSYSGQRNAGLPAGANRIFCPFPCIISVNQQCGVAFRSPQISLKSIQFVLITHHKGMRHRPFRRNTVIPGRRHVGRSCAAADISGSGRQKASHILCPPQTEFQYRTLNTVRTSRLHNSRRLGRNQTLRVKNIQKSGLRHIHLPVRPADAQHRLVRKNDFAFRNRLHIHPQFLPLKIIQKFFLKQRLTGHSFQTGQISHIFGFDFPLFRPLQKLAQAGADKISAVKRTAAEKSFRSFRLFVFPVQKPGLRHGQMIKIAIKRGSGFKVIHCHFIFLCC